MITVPLQVVLDGVSAEETSDGPASGHITGSEVAAALRAGRTVTTSRPPLEAFSAAYRTAAGEGAAAVVSVHLSRAISGTYEAAVMAAKDAPVPVTVIDSGTLAMAMGFAALAGATAAADSGSVADVTRRIERHAGASTAYFSVDSLEHLRRGGRIGAAQALLASALAVKPILTVSGGIITPYERVRTRSKAVARLEQLGCEAAAAAGGRVDVAVHHLDDEAAADGLAARLRESLAATAVDVGEVVVSEISAVLGVHVGPGTLGVVVSPQLP